MKTLKIMTIIGMTLILIWLAVEFLKLQKEAKILKQNMKMMQQYSESIINLEGVDSDEYICDPEL